MDRRTTRSAARSLKAHAEDLKRWGVTGVPRRKRAVASAGSPKPAVSAATSTLPSKPIPRTSKPAASLEAIERLVKDCTLCPLYKTATRHVFGEGDPRASLMFIGEAPGRDEDQQGRPFVGAAGQLLTKMIEAMGLKREQVYIANVLKHRPPENRVPEPNEMEACKPYLLEQIALIKPRVICTLGAVATKALLGPEIAITKVRGSRQLFEGITLVPTFHPAYLLRNPDAKKDVWKDLKVVMEILRKQAA